jgi:hypothetical protein
MEIKFSSDIIKITFGVDEEFSGRSLMMEGEPLDNGFDADAGSMVWLSPFDSEIVDEETKNQIKQMINFRNITSNFKILFMGGDSYV